MISPVEAPQQESPVVKAERAAGGVGAVIHELISLVELQFELFRLDLRESAKRLALGLALLATAAAMGVAFLCVLLIFVAVALIQGNWLGAIAAFGVSSLLGLIAAAVLAYLGLRSLRTGTTIFQRSREELGRTVQSLKQMAKR